MLTNRYKAAMQFAATVHDSIEDRGDGYQSPFLVEPGKGRSALKRDIELQFGAGVLSIVCQCTDDEYLPAGRPSAKGSAEEWKACKTACLASLRRKTDAAALWTRFNVKSKAGQLWYYQGLAEAFTERGQSLGDAGLQRLARQLAATVEAIDTYRG
jgi:hypothetical protein